MNQFTKGPWSFSSDKDMNDFPCFTIWAGDCYKVFIGEFSSSEKSITETEANAKLTHAAPDLYEALQIALKPMAHVPDILLAKCKEGSRIPALGMYSPSEVITMRAALSKVTA